MMTIATYKWTIDRYHQAIDSGVFDGQNLELLRGELVLMPPEGEPHVYFSDRAAQILRSRLAGKAQVREARPVTLPNGSEPQPDLAIIQPLDTVYLEHHPYPENIFWLIEYSYSTLAYDLGDKQIVYAQSAIPEYWVVNLRDLQLTVFQDPAPLGYQTVIQLRDGKISPLAFPDISIEVRSFFEVNRYS
jgi:Uma2 family endonuclease